MALNSLTNLKKFLILAGIAFVILVVGLILIVLFFGQRPVGPRPTPTTSPQPTPKPPGATLTPTPSIAPNIIIPPKIEPEQLPQDIKTIRQQIINSYIGKRGKDLILYQTDFSRIEYISSPDVFFVFILKNPATTAKKQAQSWFLQFGLKQQDLCDLPVRFLLTTRELRESNPNFTSLPDGCS